MSKTQAFKAFELIMRCLFWIIVNAGANDSADEIHKDFVNFMMKESK